MAATTVDLTPPPTFDDGLAIIICRIDERGRVTYGVHEGDGLPFNSARRRVHRGNLHAVNNVYSSAEGVGRVRLLNPNYLYEEEEPQHVADLLPDDSEEAREFIEGLTAEHGGARAGAGRKPKPAGTATRVEVFLPPDLHTYLEGQAGNARGAQSRFMAELLRRRMESEG